jgi:hypothetical protein
MTEMTNREMLEYAAKAAGYEVESDHQGVFYIREGTGLQSWTPWNPLTDDGDALRLAVRLNVWPVRVFSPKNHPDTIRVQAGSEYWTEITEEEIFDDPFAATRRAIVRAAAEIGKEKND